jgi:hypothetical protein
LIKHAVQQRSLLENSFAELYKEEKHHKLLSYDVNFRDFGSKIWYFTFFKTHWFGFSTV